jgi:hypothetical protein
VRAAVVLENINNAVAFYAFYVAAKVGKAGLADVTVDVWRVTAAGTATEVVTGAAAAEVGDGLYRYQLAAGSVTTEGEYVCVFKTADATVDQQHIPSLWVVNKAGLEGLTDGFGRATRAIVTGAVAAGATTTSIPTTGLAPAVTAADQLKGRILLFPDNTATAALRGQATDITGNTAGGTLTVTALSVVPAAGDVFVVQ